ncbi:MAG TPA: substrate-binding domain-containing protein, partial [Vicinamibacteria bacterium]|nr:substrate-binding domain-containing protein [Vicinamibacteria bacterium]
MDPKRVFVLLIGDKLSGEVNHFQLLQETTAVSEGRRLGLDVELAFAPGFDQARALVKRLMDRGKPAPDAVVTEPASASTLELMLNELRGRIGLIVLSAWAPSVEKAAGGWGSERPFGTVGTNHTQVGEIQGQQAMDLMPSGGRVLYVAGPLQSSAAQERLIGFKSQLG